MKKSLLILSIIILSSALKAQDLIPNKSFENWASATFFYPENFLYTSNSEAFFLRQFPPNALRSVDAYHGLYAVQLNTLTSVTDTVVGYIVNSPYTDGDLNTWHGGIPYSEMPTGIRGYYKYNIASNDAGFIVVTFSKGGTNIGTYMYALEGNHADYQLFNFTFNPALTTAPDSVVFGAASSDLFNGRLVSGASLLIDSIKFTGQVNQPAMLNNDFETWHSVPADRPEIWRTEREGMKKSTDAYDGNYAVELTTFSGNDQGSIVARGGIITTGYYSESCGCMVGGTPYTLKKDALVFYYKYTPAPGTDDKAEVNLTLKKNGTNIWQSGLWLDPAADYTRVEFPFDQATDPDSVIIFFQSSLWSNKALSYVGSTLKIDNVFFKSEETPTGLNRISKTTGMNIYPNPTSGNLSIELPSDNAGSSESRIEIYNVIGKPVYRNDNISRKSDINISNLPNGVYILKIYDGLTVRTAKIMKR